MIKNSNALFTSKTDDWATPQDFFNELNKEFNFTLDVCASEENAKCAQYFTKEIDGLKQEWHGTCFMNPPYGREISKWMEKAYKSSLEGATVVCLVPSRTDTKWWHEYAMKGQIRFIKGRLKFGNSKNSAPFPSALVIFGGGEMPSGRKETTVYSVYSGDEFVVVGTASECAKYLDIKVDTFYTYVRRKIKSLDIAKVERAKEALE